FYRRGDVFTASLHGYPMHAFPYFLGHADEEGDGEGEGSNRNHPMPPGTPWDVWSSALADALILIKTFDAEPHDDRLGAEG
ncbi:histone deacetylase family protein, partial [Rhizobium ruizarguesonis]